MTHHILVIDDDTRLRSLIGRFLEENNFQVTLAKDASEARNFMKESNFDLLIVDVMMPGETGVEFTTSLRQSSRVPIIILTARGEPDDRVLGLESGADDYLQKPFEPKELLLRINNILKRAAARVAVATNPVRSFCEFGDFTFSFEDFRLKKNNEFIHITESEAKILSILCKSQGVVISREDLSLQCGEIDDRSIDVQITRLRKKIETNPKQPHYLQTVRNRGYVLYN